MTEYQHNPLEGSERPDLNLKLHDGQDDRTSIIVVHNDRPEYLNLCLQSIAIATINNNYEIIVVDNGSGQQTQSFLDDLEDDGIKVIRNNENLYWTKAANQGIKAADKDSQYYVLMHHDIVMLNPAWLDLLISVSQSNNSGLVGFNMKSYALEDQKVNFVHESCMLVSKECYKDVGAFVEELPQEGSAFLFSFAATHKGHNPQVIKNECVHHWQTFALDISSWEKITDDAMVILPKFIREIQETKV